jgi:hypothetical protein
MWTKFMAISDKKKTEKEMYEEFLTEIPNKFNVEKPKYSSMISAPKNPGVLPDSLKNILLSDGTSLYDATNAIAKGLVDGLNYQTAVLSAGHIPSEINSYIMQYRAVARALNFAHAKNLYNWIEKLWLAADKDWKAAAFYLERMHPSFFSEVKSVARRDLPPAPLVDSCTPNAKTEDLKKLSDEELLSLLSN